MDLRAYDIGSIRANRKELEAQGQDPQTIEIVLATASRGAFKAAHPDKPLPDHLMPGQVRKTIWGEEADGNDSADIPV